jgi:DNA-binding NtrC family response regulator
VISVKANFLLINSLREPYWLQTLKKALSSLGTLHTRTENDITNLVLEGDYNIIIVDATATTDTPLLISRILAQQPEAKVIVVTASPTWRRAKAAFRAGAVDYIPKSMTLTELRSIFEALLAKI